MKKLNEGRFLHAKSRSCDNEFHATKFIYFCITAVCYVKTESNDRCSETRFLLVWCMLFFIKTFWLIAFIDTHQEYLANMTLFLQRIFCTGSGICATLFCYFYEVIINLMRFWWILTNCLWLLLNFPFMFATLEVVLILICCQ